MSMHNALVFPDGSRKRLRFRICKESRMQARFELYFGKGKAVNFDEMVTHCQSGAVLQTCSLVWLTDNVFPNQDMSLLKISELPSTD